MKDEELVHYIRQGQSSLAFRHLYKGYPAVERFIRQHGGSAEEAMDIFQDALVVFCRNAAKPDFTLDAAISTYLYAVCRFMWKDALVRKNRTSSIDISTLSLESAGVNEEALLYQRKVKSLEEVILGLGDKCRRILEAFYYQKTPMRDIAAEMGYRSEQVAKNQKFKCLEKAREIAVQKRKGGEW